MQIHTSITLKILQRRVDEFVAAVRELAAFYPGNNVMLQMGR